MPEMSIWHSDLSLPPQERRIVACDDPEVIRVDRRHGDAAEREHWHDQPEAERALAPTCTGGLDGIAATIGAVERIPERYRGGLRHGPGASVMVVVSSSQLRALLDLALAKDVPHRAVCVVRLERDAPPWATFYGVSIPGDDAGAGAFTAISATGRTWDDPHAHVAKHARLAGVPLPDSVDEWRGDVVRPHDPAAPIERVERRLLRPPGPCSHDEARWGYSPTSDAVVLSCSACGRGRIGCVALHLIPHVARTAGAWALLHRDADAYLTRQAALDRADGNAPCATLAELIARDQAHNAPLRDHQRPRQLRHLGQLRPAPAASRLTLCITATAA